MLWDQDVAGSNPVAGDVRLNVENEVAAQVAPRGFSGFKMTGAADGESCQEV